MWANGERVTILEIVQGSVVTSSAALWWFTSVRFIFEIFVEPYLVVFYAPFNKTISNPFSSKFGETWFLDGINWYSELLDN